jgi:predicted enzyme related to lactoylglutathione lyase
MSSGLLRAVDAVTVRVPDLEAGIVFYGETLGHQLSWRNDEIGQAGLQTADSSTEIVLTTELGYEPNWLVESVLDAVSRIVGGGGAVLVDPFEIPVGRVAVVSDPFGNALVLVDLSKGRYEVDADGRVTGVARRPHRVAAP